MNFATSRKIFDLTFDLRIIKATVSCSIYHNFLYGIYVVDGQYNIVDNTVGVASTA
jgi:hypothetical protein